MGKTCPKHLLEVNWGTSVLTLSLNNDRATMGMQISYKITITEQQTLNALEDLALDLAEVYVYGLFIQI